MMSFVFEIVIIWCTGSVCAVKMPSKPRNCDKSIHDTVITTLPVETD